MMEEVGFTEVKVEAWTYGSGFPKSLNLSKAIEKKSKKNKHKCLRVMEQL